MVQCMRDFSAVIMFWVSNVLLITTYLENKGYVVTYKKFILTRRPFIASGRDDFEHSKPQHVILV